MAPSYSNGFGPNTGYLPRVRRNNSVAANCRHLLAGALQALQQSVKALRNNRSGLLANLLTRAAWQVRMNLTARRLLSFPHLLVGFFVLLMLWGEYWVFDSRVASCKWDKWEKWPAGATPHHLVFVADPQLIDPHSYPDRPWLLSELTVLITDNYLRKGYKQLRTQLQPDSVFFLGDLFDGGREWKTAVGDFSDPRWAAGHRPKNEQKHVKTWNKKYGEGFWLKEYARFSDMFIKDWNTGGEQPGPWQRGRKLVAGLPGNHDLGFGDEIKIPVRDRFSAFFGDGNRVDVIGNHTIVSVDTVSLSADSSDALTRADLKSIYEPANIFLQDVQSLKQKAVEKELRFWRGEVAEVAFKHEVEDVSRPNLDNVPRLNPDQANGDFPTILLSHVPLYRDPGTPCGPLREHWPPLPKPAGQTEPVKPDHRNAISVSRGYQYQNVLSEEDSVKLVKSIGNVVHAFSGDDHDYCEVVHSDSKNNVREITVKSLNMAMGVPTPGFVMVSLFNPVDDHGKPLPGSPQQTLQTHLCHLPNQISTFIRYAVFGVVCLAAIVVRALLMPVLGFTPFTLAADQRPGAGGLLPTYKDKVEDDGYYAHHNSTTAASGSSQFRSSRLRSSSLTSSANGFGGSGGAARAGSTGRHKHYGKKWGWAEKSGPRIDIYRDDLYDSGKSRSLGSSWRAASARPRTSLGLMGREVLACAWRVAWMVLLFWAYLARKG
ncbi:hypothetical protein VD0002_g3589 [Verticillium dahliae]|uniref:Cell division control protein n=2 Tax=Verticillium dahliae TaxID=27337 RepID=G2WTE0_VERDV|nr:cell division control protein [Verticillium dahliae VdLs.17]KAH6701511.1 cell division control protein [Verticillium dahliae]EGY17381.1 cell division control protein [Verticillium dahliae VdLs.17]PNH32358.1 hypothetical protein BJF96_g4403 [Verticillium dahliae]PNH46788.1 hypothetical protein VD0004_g1371 [Verticillium dahliae]PNH52880.1 hypothetical protein VD0003_g4479 [Verticillium dahliae]